MRIFSLYDGYFLRLTPPILLDFLRISDVFDRDRGVTSAVIDLLHSILDLCAASFLILLAVLDELLVKVGNRIFLARILSRELSRFREENDDDSVSDQKHEPRTDQSHRQTPEILTGVLEGVRQMTGESRDHDENQAQFDEPKQISDFPQLSILENRVRLLRSYIVEINRFHFQKETKSIQ